MFVAPWCYALLRNVLLVLCVLSTVSTIPAERGCPVPEPLGSHELSINTRPRRMGTRRRFRLMVCVRFISDHILHLSLPTGQHEWADQEMAAYEKETTVCILRERCLLRITCQHSCLLKEVTKEGTTSCICPGANWEAAQELQESAVKHKELARLWGCQLLCICRQNKRVYHQVLSSLQQSSIVLLQVCKFMQKYAYL